MKFSLKPLSSRMIDQLKAAHAIETLDETQDICTLKNFPYTFHSLYRRGYIDTKTVSVLK